MTYDDLNNMIINANALNWGKDDNERFKNDLNYNETKDGIKRFPVKKSEDDDVIYENVVVKSKESEDKVKESKEICASISLKRLYLLLNEIENNIISDDVQDTMRMFYQLESIKHDIILLNDSDNKFSRDLFN